MQKEQKMKKGKRIFLIYFFFLKKIMNKTFPLNNLLHPSFLFLLRYIFSNFVYYSIWCSVVCWRENMIETQANEHQSFCLLKRYKKMRIITAKKMIKEIFFIFIFIFFFMFFICIIRHLVLFLN